VGEVFKEGRMKNYFNLLISVPLVVFLSGCLAFKEQAYKFDYDTGIFEIAYHDLRSVKEEKEDPKDSLKKDWASLKESVEKKDDFDPEVVAVKSKKLFQEGDALSGTAVYQVQCPKCFPSKLDLLKLLYSDGRWEVINDEIYLILPADTPLVSTNGKLIKTAKSKICVWPADTKKFEYTISSGESKGESLLGQFLSETKPSGARNK
jgi:hypothetical protein